MKKLLIGIILGLLLGVIFYFSMTLFVSNEIISQNFARVTIKNESGRNVKSILLQHQRGEIEANGLNNEGEIRFIFENRGENVYHIIVTLENNTTLTSNEVYFEVGYRGTVTIKETEIIPNIN